MLPRFAEMVFIRSVCTTVLVFLSVLFCALSPIVPGANAQSAEQVSSENAVNLGQRMYREGILPSGEPMQSIIKGDVVVQGTSFTCVSCHMTSGLGSVEGGVITTPTNGRSLYSARMQPSGIRSNMGGGMGQNKKQMQPQPPPGRPAYTDMLLASVLRGGVDPSGRVLDPVMPRYKLNDQDMSTLVTYLKSLSSDVSPGADSQTLHFATIISEDVAAELRYEQADLLDIQFSRLNEHSRDFEKRLKDPKLNRHMSKTGRLLYRNLSLSRWLLKGPPETWRSQLEEYYKKQPVFALLGGTVTGDWKPIHDFSEAHKLPCLFPQTDFPVVSEVDSYTMYLSKGYYQEGEGIARYINRTNESKGGNPTLQIVRESDEGRALAAGFDAAWQDMGHQPAVTLRLKAGDVIDRENLEKLLEKYRPSALLLWDGVESVKLLTVLAEMKIRPDRVFVSSSYLGKYTTSVPETIRPNVYLSYPYRLPHDEEPFETFYFGSALVENRNNAAVKKIIKQSFLLNKVFVQLLTEMKDNFYRDYFLDVLGMLQDMDAPLYERLSFGPGQRYASKGCYVVQLSTGKNPTYIKKNDWVTH